MEIKMIGLVAILVIFFGLLHLLLRIALVDEGASALLSGYSKRALRMQRAYLGLAVGVMLLSFVFWVAYGFWALYF
jgi:hypothetical protein